MTRLHADQVEVRTRAEASGPVPEQFLWRGRLYLVREVLARWTASGAWWKGPEGELDDREQQWWRVEADSGRLAALSGGRGTYDLCFSWAAVTPAAVTPDSSWTLRRVLD